VIPRHLIESGYQTGVTPITDPSIHHPMSETAQPDDSPDPTNPRIVRTEGVIGGKPRIEGTRIGVRFVREQVEGRGLTPRDVAERYELDVADVHRALAYYHEHPDEMRELERRREENLERIDEVAIGPEDIE
jgi:uncharacterized protein (DUF433 family)